MQAEKCDISHWTDTKIGTLKAAKDCARTVVPVT
jgi:hypothetical protein